MEVEEVRPTAATIDDDDNDLDEEAEDDDAVVSSLSAPNCRLRTATVMTARKDKSARIWRQPLLDEEEGRMLRTTFLTLCSPCRLFADFFSVPGLRRN